MLAPHVTSFLVSPLKWRNMSKEWWHRYVCKIVNNHLHSTPERREAQVNHDDHPLHRCRYVKLATVSQAVVRNI